MVDADARRATARTALESLAGTGYVLAGASALIEHGLIPRETVDVDLFTTSAETMPLPEVLDRLHEEFTARGGSMEVNRTADQYANVLFHLAGATIEGDLGTDWRGHSPVRGELGPMLDERDAVGNKVAALYSRRAARDYMDVAAIALSGRWTHRTLIDAARNQDPGIGLDMLADALASDQIPASDRFAAAGLTPDVERVMRHALTHLHRGVDYEHRVELVAREDPEAAEAMRISAAGKMQPLTEQLRTWRASPPARHVKGQSRESDRAPGYGD